MGKRRDVTPLLETLTRTMIMSITYCNMDMALHTCVSKRSIQRTKAKMHVGAAIGSDRVDKCGPKNGRPVLE